MGNKVRYIGGWDTIALTLGKEYEVLSIEKGWYRIMSDLGEDYLFPPKLFEPESDTLEKVVANLITADMEAHPEWKDTLDILNK